MSLNQGQVTAFAKWFIILSHLGALIFAGYLLFENQSAVFGGNPTDVHKAIFALPFLILLMPSIKKIKIGDVEIETRLKEVEKELEDTRAVLAETQLELLSVVEGELNTARG